MANLEVLSVPDILKAVDARAQALLGLAAQQALHQGPAMFVLEAARELQRLLENRAAHLAGIVEIVSKWQVATYKLKEHHPHGPKVHLCAVAAASHDLGGHVVRRADHGECLLSVLQLLGNAKVNQLEIALPIQHDVLWLQVTIDDVAVSKLLYDDDQGASVELRLDTGENSGNPADCIMQLAAGEQLLKHVDALGCLKGLHQCNDERMIVFSEQITLPPDFLGHPPLVLVNALQRIPHAGGLVPHQPHHTGCPCPNNFRGLEILEGHVRVLQPYAVHQILLHVAIDDLCECGLVNTPKLGLST
mmetsp:Transcript_96485/g.223714  ORF Transcript_96485/g.223714 Transcript_96485/m.223714 type:complete len:304 (+) Transcript_96485:306-1217(+)